MKGFNKKLYVSNIYLVLVFNNEMKNLTFGMNSSIWIGVEECRVSRAFSELNQAKKYQKRLASKGCITALIQRRLYEKW